MSFERYDIFFSGQILPDQQPEEVRKRLGKLFKASGKQLDRLFSGRPIRIKHNVDMDKAIRYRVMFRDIGALIDIRPIEPTQATSDETREPVREPLRAPQRIPDLELLPPHTGSLEDCAPRAPAAPSPGIPEWTLDTPGALIDTRPPPPPAAIDTSGLSALPPNSGSLEEFDGSPEPVELPDIRALRLVD